MEKTKYIGLHLLDFLKKSLYNGILLILDMRFISIFPIKFIKNINLIQEEYSKMEVES